MNFFRDVVSHLLKNAFEGHTQFSVADNTAVGDNPIRSISLDAVPVNNDTIISLSWDGGEKIFEKTLSEQESKHQFELISSDLAEVAALTKQGQYDAAKDLMKKLGEKYAENTGDIVDTNLPKLHNTQAAHKHNDDLGHITCDRCHKQMCSDCGITEDDGIAHHSKCKKEASQDKLAFDTEQMEEELREAILDAASQMKGIPQTKAYDIAKDLLEYFPRNSDVIKYINNFIGNEFDLRHYVEDVLSEVEDENIISSNNSDDKIWKQAKITMQNLWFSTTDELLDYQKKQKGVAQPGDQDHIPLWDKNKAPADKLAPASLSYEDLEDKKQQEHEDMQDHIDEKIKTELESALQQKAASVFGPDQVELVQVLRKNGRNWDEIKKILVKDFGFDKDSTNIFVDEQRQGSDPTGIEVEPVKEEEKPLTPPEELVSPETHDKLLKDHEDKKKDNSPIEAPKEQNFTPKEIMDIPEDEEIHDESSLSNEIARADNDDIHKVASILPESVKQEVINMPQNLNDAGDIFYAFTPQNNTVYRGMWLPRFLADDFHKMQWMYDSSTGEFKENPEYKPSAYASLNKKADDTNPLQEPIEQAPTTPSQDVVPMGKKPLDHEAPQKGDRVFVASDMSDEKAGFEGIFVSSYKSEGRDQYIVETDEGDLLDVDAHRVSKISDNNGAQTTEPSIEPIIETVKEEPIKVTPKMNDFQSSLDTEALAIKAELEKIATLVKEADDEQLTMWDERSYDEKYPMMAKYPEVADNIVNLIKKHGDNWYKIEQGIFDESPFYMMNLSKQVGSNEGAQLIRESYDWLKENESGADKVFTPRTYDEIKASLKEASKKCQNCNKEFTADSENNKFCSKECWKASGANIHSSLKKEAGTTWHDLRMPEPPQPGWSVEHKSGLTGTVVDGNDKFANVQFDQPITREQLRDLDISEIQFDRGDHQEGVYAIYAGDGFASLNGNQPNWTMMDSSGKPIYPKGYQPPKPMEHDVIHETEPAIDTESSLKEADYNKIMVHCKDCNKTFYTLPDSGVEQCPECMMKRKASLKEAKMINWNCPKCNNSASASDVYDEKICMKDGCGTSMKKEADLQDTKCEDCGEPLGPEVFLSKHPVCGKCARKKHKKVTQSSDFEKGISQNKTAEANCVKCGAKVPYELSDKQVGGPFCYKCLTQNKTAAPDPTEAPKTQFKDYKITPKYAPKQEAVPATPEIDAVLSKMNALETNLATLETARKQIQAKMQEEMNKIDQSGNRVEMEAQLQESIEKAGILISAVESKVVQWKDKLYTLQTEQVDYVPKLTPKEMLSKIYAKFDGAEKYVQDVLNGILSQAKRVTENTLIRWPNKKSELMTKADSSLLDIMNHYNDELMAALKELSSPL